MLHFLFALVLVIGEHCPIKVSSSFSSPLGVLSVLVTDTAANDPRVFFVVMNVVGPPMERRVAANLPDVCFDCHYEDGTAVDVSKLGSRCIFRGGRVMNASFLVPLSHFRPEFFSYKLSDYFVFKKAAECQISAAILTRRDCIRFKPQTFCPLR